VVIYKGAVIIEEIPIPFIENNEILVKLNSSCLSIGTEMSGINTSAIPMWKRAINQPNKINKLFDLIKSEGLTKTIKIIEEKKETISQTGYSASGIIIAVGSEITDLKIGDRIACAGGGYAVHAEYIRVPRNLCTIIPDNVNYEAASTVTLGAIALQGIRRASPTLGETFVVIGLGVIGQLTTQILKANGCKVIGIDPNQERLNLALSIGMNFGQTPEAEVENIFKLTNGFGADGIIITAASDSNQIVSSAFKMCRKKGRVVLVGDVGLNLIRSDFYSKEVDFFISTSYGPGRYDTNYEEKGVDYPISYVRWTENRNMQEYINLIYEGKVDIEKLSPFIYDINDAKIAYESLKNANNNPLLVLLKYSENSDSTNKKVIISSKNKESSNKIKVALIGTGGFARTAHLPNLSELSDLYELRAIVNRTGSVAKEVGKLYKVNYVTSEPQEVFDDPEIDAIIITTRHNTHTSLVIRALKAGKHVLVEKPLSITSDELNELNNYITLNSNKSMPILLTGFNRRFSPFAKRMKILINQSLSPIIINYRMNAGFISKDHWVHGNEGGGRNIGEACHIYDLFTFFTDSSISEISAFSIRSKSEYFGRNDNFNASIKFENGSVANLTYTALGNKKYSKEMADIYFDGKLAILEDYYKLSIYGCEKDNIILKNQDKGFKNELIEFAKGINTGEWPIPWWQQFQTTSTALKIEKLILD
jgi:predicted dehydrogenase/threonine dehydrogenase-like Zn-dependent dehydrogenase